MKYFLFDYIAFLEELKDKPDKKKIYEEWRKISQADRLEDEPFYEHLLQFEPIPYKIPEELRNDFDWDLLLRLVAASHSSDYHFETKPLSDDEKQNGKPLLPCLHILVSNGQKNADKDVSTLWSFTIIRLFEIYLEEQINIHTVMQTEKDAKESIGMEREKKVKTYQIARIKAINEINKIKFLG